MYKDDWVHTSFKQMQKDYFLYSAQAYTGVKFNVGKKPKALLNVLIMKWDRLNLKLIHYYHHVH